ncbi:hypothetical protein ACQSME_09355 [Streptomyces sp. 2-6]
MLVGAGERCVFPSARAVTLLPLRAVTLPSARVRGHGHPAHRTPRTLVP